MACLAALAALAAVSLAAAAAGSAGSEPHLTVRPVVARNQVISPSAFAAQMPKTCVHNGGHVQCTYYPTVHGNLHLGASALLPRPGGKDQQVWFLTFRMQGRGMCLAIVVMVYEKGRGFTARSAPTCDETDLSRCQFNVCDLDTDLGPHSGVAVLLVPASAHTLRILLGHDERSYRLTGPVIRGMPNVRPFVLDLSGIGHVSWTPWFEAAAK